MSARVVAVTATYRRPCELARLLASLTGIECIVVCDNSADDDVHAVVRGAPLPAHLLTPGRNLGCGGGLRLAEEHAWKITGGSFSHLLVLDDDAVLKSDTVSGLVEILERERADAAYPLVVGPDGRVGWAPGLKDRTLRRLEREKLLPDDYRRRLGVAVADFAWAQGICLLARRTAVEAAGFHRADFWVRGEDLDFSLRLTARGRGILAPAVEVHHLPPPATAASDQDAEFLRHAAMVQNIAFLALTQAHGAPIRAAIAGASLRFVRTWGMRSFPDLLRALWRGARGEPAGAGSGLTFRHRFDECVAR